MKDLKMVKRSYYRIRVLLSLVDCSRTAFVMSTPLGRQRLLKSFCLVGVLVREGRGEKL